MEYCSGGELFERIIKKEHFTEKEAASIMYKLFHAVNYLHNINICHRDIKPENCLFVNESDEAEIKLIDFGLAYKFGKDKDSEMHSIVGTPYYIAPEVLLNKYGPECDL